MHLTPDMLSAGYDFLRHTKPFDGWNLPEPEDMRFDVLKGASRFGDCCERKGQFIIRVSEALHQRYTGVLATLAHEMIHLHMDNLACASKYRRLRTDNSTHGPGFRALAIEVCDAFPEFDPVTF